VKRYGLALGPEWPELLFREPIGGAFGSAVASDLTTSAHKQRNLFLHPSSSYIHTLGFENEESFFLTQPTCDLAH
jgi:hypothetical protein